MTKNIKTISFIKFRQEFKNIRIMLLLCVLLLLIPIIIYLIINKRTKININDKHTNAI